MDLLKELSAVMLEEDYKKLLEDITMPKTVSFADPNFRKNLHDWMQTINPKPIGKDLENLLEKYKNERAEYIERHRKGAGVIE